jgi:hypothetical protein
VVLSAYAGGTTLLYGVDISAPFTDDDNIVRLGIAYTQEDTGVGGLKTHGFGKITPAGVADDAGFNPTVDDATPGCTFNCDRIALAIGTVGGAHAGFVLYRDGADLYAFWEKTKKSASNAFQLAPAAVKMSNGVNPAPFTDPDTGTGESFALALGTVAGKELLGAVWREKNADGTRCFFRRVDAETLDGASLGAVVPLTTGACSMPRLAFNPASGRFVATFAEQLAGGGWQISFSEVSIGASDTASASTAVVTGLTAAPAQLEAQIYTGGNYVGIVYRMPGATQINLNGFHVSPF